MGKQNENNVDRIRNKVWINREEERERCIGRRKENKEQRGQEGNKKGDERGVNFWSVILLNSSRHSSKNTAVSNVCRWTASSTRGLLHYAVLWWVSGFYQGRSNSRRRTDRTFLWLWSCPWNVCSGVYTLTSTSGISFNMCGKFEQHNVNKHYFM
jgi:hypothetical protein